MWKNLMPSQRMLGGAMIASAIGIFFVLAVPFMATFALAAGNDAKVLAIEVEEQEPGRPYRLMIVEQGPAEVTLIPTNKALSVKIISVDAWASSNLYGITERPENGETAVGYGELGFLEAYERGLTSAASDSYSLFDTNTLAATSATTFKLGEKLNLGDYFVFQEAGGDQTVQLSLMDEAGDQIGKTVTLGKNAGYDTGLQNVQGESLIVSAVDVSALTEEFSRIDGFKIENSSGADFKIMTFKRSVSRQSLASSSLAFFDSEQDANLTSASVGLQAWTVSGTSDFDSCPDSSFVEPEANTVLTEEVTYCLKIVNQGTANIGDPKFSDATLGLDNSKLVLVSGEEIVVPGASATYALPGIARPRSTTDNVAVTVDVVDDEGNLLAIASPRAEASFGEMPGAGTLPVETFPEPKVDTGSNNTVNAEPTAATQANESQDEALGAAQYQTTVLNSDAQADGGDKVVAKDLAIPETQVASTDTAAQIDQEKTLPDSAAATSIAGEQSVPVPQNEDRPAAQEIAPAQSKQNAASLGGVVAKTDSIIGATASVSGDTKTKQKKLAGAVASNTGTVNVQGLAAVSERAIVPTNQAQAEAKKLNQVAAKPAVGALNVSNADDSGKLGYAGSSDRSWVWAPLAVVLMFFGYTLVTASHPRNAFQEFRDNFRLATDS